MEKEKQPENKSNMKDRFMNTLPFFTEKMKEDGTKKITIHNEKLIAFWESLGYRKVVDENGQYVLVIVTRNSIVKEVKEHTLRGAIRDYIDYINRRDVWIEYLNKEYIVKKLFETFHTIEINRNAGNTKTGYLFYRNIILLVTSDKAEFVEYEDFDGYVWELEILKRDYADKDDKECVFGAFLQIIANEEQERLQSIISIVGYLIHSFKDSAFAKAIILMDSEIDIEFDEANGGTGKSLIGKAISYIVPSLFIDGKTIRSKDKFRLSGLNSQHRIIFFDDVTKDFDFESLYPLITGDLHIEKKYKNAVVIPNKETPKILITSNYVVKGGGGNAEKRRKIEYEVSAYFKNESSPLEEFGHRLFDDWDHEEWLRFDNFMVKSLQYYLKKGLIEPMSINVDFNRLKLETSVEFIDFMDSLLRNPSQNNIQSSSGVLVFDKAELFKEFTQANLNTIDRVTIIILKKWIEKYCGFHHITSNHYKSNGKVFVELNITNRINRNEDQNGISGKAE